MTSTAAILDMLPPVQNYGIHYAISESPGKGVPARMGEASFASRAAGCFYRATAAELIGNRRQA